MKIAVVGKGGSGKTTTSGVLARTLGRSGHRVIALDCDTNPNLGLSLGVGDTETERLLTLRDMVDEGSKEHAESWDEILDSYGADGPDGVRLTVINRIENPEPGWPWCGLSAEQLLSSVPSNGVVIVADLEAGIGTLTRLEDQSVDATVVVVEPTPRSMDVATSARAVASDRRQGRVIIAANKVSDAEDERRLRDAFPDQHLLVVPADPVIDKADRQGLSPVDVDPDSPAVSAIKTLANILIQTSTPGDNS